MDKVPTDEVEPDARFAFANERTSLAWSRTALALVTAGLAIAQLLWGPFRVGVTTVAGKGHHKNRLRD